MKAQRDEFIEYLFNEAKSDPNIIFISVDMGAPALDQWREELPNQFVAAGISEQNAINFAAGLAAAGKKPYVYMMACWVARCFEQIRYSCAMPQNAVTIIGNGVALGYAPAGPAHEPTEDLCYMRAIEGIEIISPSTPAHVRFIAERTLKVPALRYIRLERSVATRLIERKSAPLDSGVDLLRLFEGQGGGPQLTILSSGYLLDRAIDVANDLSLETNWSVQILDVWKIKPLNLEALSVFISGSDLLITVEEQARDGAFGAAILEAVSDLELMIPTVRLSLSSAYAFENGSRDELLDQYGLSREEIKSRILGAIERRSIND
jgi:transketolase